MTWDPTRMTRLFGSYHFSNGIWNFENNGIYVLIGSSKHFLSATYSNDKYVVDAGGWKGAVEKCLGGAVLAYLKRPGTVEEVELMAGVEGETILPISGAVQRIRVSAGMEGGARFFAKIQDTEVVGSQIELLTILETALARKLSVEANYIQEGGINRLLDITIEASRKE